MVNSIFKAFLKKKIKEVDEEIIKDSNNSGEKNKFINFIYNFIEQKGGIDNILIKYKFENGEVVSLVKYVKNMLLLEKEEMLIERDPKRYFLGSLPVSKYVFENILNLNNTQKLELNFLGDNNPFKIKYNGVILNNSIKKFECLRDYINEVSHSVDAPGIGGLSGATDFLQLYKYIMLDDIIEENDKEIIIEKLFELLKKDNVDSFLETYKIFIVLLKQKNKNNDKRLSRLYNRMYYIFSYILNSLKPNIFPIYFGKTRSVLKKFNIQGYINVCEIYKITFEDKRLIQYIENFISNIGINEKDYILNNLLKYNKDLFINFGKYRFLQDICYVLYEKVIHGEDYINNFPENIINYQEIKNNDYFNSKKINNNNNITKVYDIFDEKFLNEEGYIYELEKGKYKILKRDNNLIPNKINFN